MVDTGVAHSAMTGDEASPAASQPVLLRHSSSAHPFKVNELIRPGTVALRVQALNDRFVDRDSHPGSTRSSSRSQAGQPIDGRSPQAGKISNASRDHLALAKPTEDSDQTSSSLQRFDSGIRSGFGKRPGGGWAPPAGRRISYRQAATTSPQWAHTFKAANLHRNSSTHLAAQSLMTARSSPELRDPHPRSSFAPRDQSHSSGNHAEHTDLLPDVESQHMTGPATKLRAAQHPPVSRPPIPALEIPGMCKLGQFTIWRPLLIFLEPHPSTRYHTPSGFSAIDGRIQSSGARVWGDTELLSGPVALTPTGSQIQPTYSPYTGQPSDRNPWRVTASPIAPLSRTRPSVSATLQGGRVSSPGRSLDNPKLGPGNFFDSPLVRSPETYFRGYSRISYPEQTSPLPFEKTKIRSPVHERRFPNQPFSFSGGLEQLDTMDTVHQPTRTRPAPRHPSASQASLQALLRTRSSEEIIRPSKPLQAATSRTSNSFLSLIPRLFSRSEQSIISDAGGTAPGRVSESPSITGTRVGEGDVTRQTENSVSELEAGPLTCPTTPSPSVEERASGRNTPHRRGRTDQREFAGPDSQHEVGDYKAVLLPQFDDGPTYVGADCGPSNFGRQA